MMQGRQECIIMHHAQQEHQDAQESMMHDKIVSTTNNIQQLITILANVDITSHDDNSLKPDHMMQRLVSLPRFT